MKKLFLFCLLFFVGKLLIAQSNFPSDSASWYHEMNYGSFHSYVVGDTIIQNTHAKRIRQEALVKQPWFNLGLKVYNLPNVYVYSTADTTFIFNPIFNRFTPLYIFNAQEGDSICLPLLQAGGGSSYIGSMGDSTFCFVVDSIRIVKYDTAMLKTFYTHSFTKTNQIKLNWGTTQFGAYAERIGAVFSGLVPHCVSNFSCATLASDNYQGAGALRCYSDEAYSIKLVNDCANGGISVSVDNVAKEISLKISPNPAKDFIRIDFDQPEKISSIVLINALGQSVFSSNKPQSNISLKHLPEGIYFLKIILDGGNSFTEKTVVRH